MSEEDLPGFSPAEKAKPPSRRELEAQDREYRALAIWHRTGSEGEVRKALKLRSKAEANVLINRAVKRWKDEQGEHLDRLRTFQDALILRSARVLAEKVEQGEVQRIPDLLKVLERMSKFHDLDAGKDAQEGPQVLVIEARRPWERDDVIDGEAEDVPPGLPDGS